MTVPAVVPELSTSFFTTIAVYFQGPPRVRGKGLHVERAIFGGQSRAAISLGACGTNVIRAPFSGVPLRVNTPSCGTVWVDWP